MDEPVEIELKLDFDPADRDRLVACPLFGPEPAATRRLNATYFDTPGFHLDKAGYALRIRSEGGERIQTVKAASREAAGLFVRGEWERPVPGDEPIVDEKSGPLVQLFDTALLSRLRPVFTTAVDRTQGPVDHPDGSRVDYAIDLGEVRAGTRGTTLCELELELKGGAPQALFDLARTLGELVPLRLGVSTKSERGYALADSAFTAAVKAEPLTLDRTMAAGDAFAVIVASCLRQYRRNEDLLLLSGGVEQLHQARVALRRLRTAFWLFEPLLDGDDRAEAFVSELRWLAAELGAIRDIDVLVPRLEESARAALFAVRENRFGHLRNLLDSGRVRLLPIELAEWLALGRWRTGPADPELRDRHVRAFAGDRLDRLRKRIKRAGKGLADADDEHRHEVRKDAKKLRYAAEFFLSLYSGRKTRRRMERFLDRLEALQDKLGQLNDIATAPRLFTELGVEVPPSMPGRKERKRLLDDAEDCFEALIETKRFWRD
nr:CHAD domain-containing protein [Sphingomonas sp. Y57]